MQGTLKTEAQLKEQLTKEFNEFFQELIKEPGYKFLRIKGINYKLGLKWDPEELSINLMADNSFTKDSKTINNVSQVKFYIPDLNPDKVEVVVKSLGYYNTTKRKKLPKSLYESMKEYREVKKFFNYI